MTINQEGFESAQDLGFRGFLFRVKCRGSGYLETLTVEHLGTVASKHIEVMLGFLDSLDSP